MTAPKSKNNATPILQKATLPASHQTPKAAKKTERGKNGTNGERISLAPLDIKNALSALLTIPDPDATKPKRKKAPPTPEKE